MSKDSETQKSLLEKFRFPDCAGVYELGCSADLQNIHSQQQRAFNLAWALQSLPGGCSTKKFAIIGGGISGITLAAGLVVSGAEVTIYEAMVNQLYS